MPRTGASMLFAYADESGRLAVVRTGPLVRFETLAEPRETIVSLPDYEDDCVTIPLPSPIAPPTTERRPSAWLVPTAPISEADDTIREDITLDGGILEDDKSATVPHLAADLPPTWPKLPMDREATVRPISILDADDAPTRSRRSVPDKRPAAPTPRGMLPKRATRG